MRVDVPTWESVQSVGKLAEHDDRGALRGRRIGVDWTTKHSASPKEGIVTSGINTVVKVSVNPRLALNT